MEKKNNVWMLILGILILILFIPGFFSTLLNIAGSVIKIAAVIIGVLLVIAFFIKKKN